MESKTWMLYKVKNNGLDISRDSILHTQYNRCAHSKESGTYGVVCTHEKCHMGFCIPRRTVLEATEQRNVVPGLLLKNPCSFRKILVSLEWPQARHNRRPCLPLCKPSLHHQHRPP